MKYYKNLQKKDVVFLMPGEYISSEEDLVISTVLGSCIAIALYDPKKAQGGMNHFLLAHNPGKDYSKNLPGRYGMTAMELLINDLLKMGSSKEDLVAHVLGGSSTNKYRYSKMQTVAVRNIRFAFKYLETEGIPIGSIDVGGQSGRKVMFKPSDGKLKVTQISLAKYAMKDFNYYNDKINSNPPKAGNIYLFE